VLLLTVNALVHSIITASIMFGWQHRIGGQAFTVVSEPFPVNSDSLASYLYLIAMLAILVNRFARTRREEERYASEMEAARVVQQVLIPEAIPSVPGFCDRARVQAGKRGRRGLLPDSSHGWRGCAGRDRGCER
jgi:hypothetical protein